MGLFDLRDVFTLILPRLPLIIVILAGLVYAITQLHLGAPAKYIIGACAVTLINIVLSIAFQVWAINSSSFDSPLYLAYGFLNFILAIASWILIFIAVFIGRSEPIKKEFDGYRP